MSLHLRAVPAEDKFSTPLTGDERDLWIERIMERPRYQHMSRAGNMRIQDWEQGWSENVEDYKRDGTLDALVPKYFGKYPVGRRNGELVKWKTRTSERAAFEAMLRDLFSSLTPMADKFMEFGCGTGTNLGIPRRLGYTGQMIGLDWALSSGAAITETAARTNDDKLQWSQFDLFNPNYGVTATDAVVFTCAALEQVGRGFDGFLSYLLEQRPALCIHVEPIVELLDPDRLLDYLSIRYSRARNYLAGFLPRLRVLEAQGKIKIHHLDRGGNGSLLLDGYQTIIWSPR